MNNFKKFLLLVVITPVLFVGCVSEKTAILKPEIIKKETSVTENNQTVLESLLQESNISETNISKEVKLLTSAVLHERLSVKENPILKDNQTFVESQEENPITFDEMLTTQTLNIDDSWEELTKEDEILETAKEFLGTKYIWAANGPFAFDCSGFTKYVFDKIGISLPRYSGHQANIGEKINFKNLEKGDLVFFDTDKKFRHQVNHVGIFIGDNKFIHASSAKKKVIITSFSKKKFYKNKFLYARRVINVNESVALNLTK